MEPNLTQIDIYSCSLYSSWQPVQVYLEPYTDTYFHSSTIDDNVRSLSLLELWNPSGTRFVRLDIDWANSELPCNETVGNLTNFIDKEPVTSLVDYFGYSVSILVTDALARLGMDIQATIALDFISLDDASTFGNFYGMVSQNVSHVDKESFTEISLARTRFGYSYSANGITRRLGIVALLMHVLIVVIHTTLVLWYGWSCTDLGSIRDLVIMSIRASTGFSQDSSLPPVTELRKKDINIKVQRRNDSEFILVFGDLLRSSNSAEGDEEELLSLNSWRPYLSLNRRISDGFPQPDWPSVTR